jgi:hypothetical protein
MRHVEMALRPMASAASSAIDRNAAASSYERCQVVFSTSIIPY